MSFLRNIFGALPRGLRHEINRYRYRSQIKRGKFVPNEPDITILPHLLSAGDWAYDIGANIGYYSFAMANIVGPKGRVLAFEPIPDTFDLLASNTYLAPFKNISLINAAASSTDTIVSMSIPTYEAEKLENYYQARISISGDNNVVCFRIDSLPALHRIALVKIDAEGHDLDVIKGMQALIARDQPALIVESQPKGAIPTFLSSLGYRIEHIAGSPNIIAVPLTSTFRR